MAIREDTDRARADARPARHGRPRPLGGRFALPSLRFSGAAMAMSTVVGISAATTWLVTAQQQIGRHPGVITPDSSLPPLPTPEAAAQLTPRPTMGPTAATGDPQGTGRPGTPAASPSPAAPTRTAQAQAGHAPTARPSVPVSSPSPAFPAPPVMAAAPPSAPATPAAPVTSPPSGPPRVPVAPTPTPTPTQPTAPPVKPPVNPPQEGLAGKAVRDLLGPSGTRHTVTLRVGEPLTALQVELRLERPEALPGTTPWSSLPGTVVTVLQERGTLVYRFTVPAGQDIEPGEYSFGVRGVRRTGTGTGAPAGKAAQPQESWTASAFALVHPRALAIRGIFG
ncbi:hypothetical protein GCM10009760_25430 [Kitasatospora kazusensis]|uniref:Uncharacterized protein n=1 Tax=Kitasatospora kazusensis TaxID=407974 RepID=A0ABP5L9W6_9ACTN